MVLAPRDVGEEERQAITLVSAHRSGDPDAFAEIVRIHYPVLLSIARRQLRSTVDAEDALQETFLRAFVALDRFGESGDWRLGAWLRTILFRVCTDIPARRRRTVPVGDLADDARIATKALDANGEQVPDHVARAAIERAFAGLPENLRRAAELRLIDGRPYDEVADTLGITQVNARQQVRRARRSLMHALKGAGGISGTLAMIPAVLTSASRTIFRRALAGVGSSAREAGNQALSTGAGAAASGVPVATTATAAGSIASGPIGAGVQLVAQVSTTPIVQAAVASAGGVAGAPKGSVVLGIVASLATAGGLGAPAIISPAAHAQALPAGYAIGAPASVHVVRHALRSPSRSPQRALGTGVVTPATTPVGSASGPGTGTSAATGPTASRTGNGNGTTQPPATVETTPGVATTSWISLASSSITYRQQTSPGVTGPAGTVTRTTLPTTAPVPSSSTSSTTPSTTPGAVPAAGAPATPVARAAAGSPGPTVVMALPIGSCTSVAGFPGVTAPTSLPAITTSVLDAVLSTGPDAMEPGTSAPAFSGTALLKATGAAFQPVSVHVGTCLAGNGSLLAVDMAGSTGSTVQLVGSLVSAPFDAPPATGYAPTNVDYLFRGNVTPTSATVVGAGSASASLPWGLPGSFVAEVSVTSTSQTAALSVVFLQPIDETPAEQGTTSPASTPSPTTAASTASAPASTVPPAT